VGDKCCRGDEAGDHSLRRAKGDSTVVVKQMKREWKTNTEALRSLRTEADGLVVQFESFDITWIRRSENRAADALGRAK